jgi:hypothetical protein
MRVNHKLVAEELTDETAYDRLRLVQWREGHARDGGVSRRDLIRLSAGVGFAAVSGTASGWAMDPPAEAGWQWPPRRRVRS